MTTRTGQVALVTGGANGVGAALCRRLASDGAHVVVADVDSEGAETLAAEIAGSALSFDVQDRAAWEAAVSAVVRDHGRLDVLGLNAGLMSRPKGEAMGGDDPLTWLRDRYELVRGVNLDGVVFGVLATVPTMQAACSGGIVVTSSIAGVTPQVEDPAYTATKHALVGLVRSLAPTLAKDGITIGAVCPGGVDTSLVPPDFREAGYSFAPPEHVADSLVGILDKGIDETGGIWVTLGVDNPPWRYEAAPIR